MYKIIIQERAVYETKDAYEWYESKSIGLGKRFNTEVRKALNLIKQQPDRYAIKQNFHREVRVKDFPYLIIYLVNDDGKEILITSVFHVKRNPASKY